MLELLLFWLIPRVQQQRNERCLQGQTDMGGAQKASTQASASLRLYGAQLVLTKHQEFPRLTLEKIIDTINTEVEK